MMRNMIVTGGSRGLGLAIARTLVGAGYCAIAIARKNSEQLTAAIAEATRDRPIPSGSFRSILVASTGFRVSSRRCANAMGRSTAS
jgi:NAD(P)-dependent dehydrogenase (short-subunit alcohol dehydrogenase family)